MADSEASEVLVEEALKADSAEAAGEALEAAAPPVIGEQIMRKVNPKKFFSKEEEDRIVAAIRSAEQKTSGEIRLHLTGSLKKPILEEAAATFEKLGMAKTDQKNGVLIFLTLSDRQFAVIGDTAIHEKVGEDFWHKVRRSMEDHFKQNAFASGIEHGIATISEELTRHFPRSTEDRNELCDDLSYE